MTELKTLQRLDVFISSPGDVKAERQLVLRVIERLNNLKHIKDQCVLQPLAYEEQVPSSIGAPPQMVVDRYMTRADKSDIFICILAQRMGTEVLDEATDRTFQSGTEYEFVLAYEANQRQGAPHILLYRGRKPDDGAADADQQARVEAFFQRFEGPNAAYKGLYKLYRSHEEFEDMLFNDLNTVVVELLRTREPAVSAQSGAEAAPLTWHELRQRVQGYTTRMLGNRYREKYNPQSHTPRQQVVSHFNSFLASDKRATVVTGKSGTGKSSLVCGLATSQLSEALVWLQDCAVLSPDSLTDMDVWIARSLDLPVSSALAQFEAGVKADPARKVVLLFDAVNEFPDNRHRLLNRLADLVTHISTPNVKVVLTCRVPAWNSLKKHFTVPVDWEYHAGGPDSYISIDTFAAEELPQVYENYQHLYTIPTPFDELAQQVRLFITQPLFLKLTMEAYQGKSIPKKLVLKEVFTRYVNRCLGEQGLDSPEFVVLKRAIELMYEHAQRELKLAVLRQDEQVGQYVPPEVDTGSPYAHLLEAGLLSQRIDEGLMRKIETVFVTYERVFEFLLSDIVCGNVTIERILELLELSQGKAFIQLRGAVELAFSFAIMNGTLPPEAIMQIAAQEEANSRQFLSDVIQTIYESGEHALVEKLFFQLGQQEDLALNQLALNAAYQLKLVDQLVALALSGNPTVRDTAVLYIYQLWNQYRLKGNLDEGYEVVRKIVASIRLARPQRSVRALSALMSLTINLLVHIIDDPQSLLPLLAIYQDMVRRVPGLEPRTDRSMLGRLIADNVTPTIIDILSEVLALLLKETVMSNDNLMMAFFKEPKNKRALLDVGLLLDLDNLVGREKELVTLITWRNPLIHYANIGTMIHFLYHQPELHIPMIQNIFYGEYDCNFRVKFDAAHAMTYAAVCRMRGGKPIPEGCFEILEDFFVELWDIAHERDPETGQTWLELDGTGNTAFFEKEGMVSVKRSLQQGILTGLFALEFSDQQKTGRITGSTFLRRFMADPANHLQPLDIQVLLEALEKFAYQGRPEFAVRSILDEKIRTWWETKAYDYGVQVLANIRAFYQETVDDLLLMDEANKPLWARVRVCDGQVNIRQIFFNNANLWMISSSIQWVVLKVLGVAAFELVFSDSVAELMRRLAKILITTLFDYDIINIGYMEWHLAHNPSWDNWEKWGIPRSLQEVKPAVHDYYRAGVQEFLETCGRGILYGEL